MKITINAFESCGDIQPYVAFGRGFRTDSNEVLITTHQIFEDLVLKNGFDSFPIDVDPHEVLINQAVADLGNNPVKVARWMPRTSSR